MSAPPAPAEFRLESPRIGEPLKHRSADSRHAHQGELVSAILTVARHLHGASYRKNFTDLWREIGEIIGDARDDSTPRSVSRSTPAQRRVDDMARLCEAVVGASDARNTLTGDGADRASNPLNKGLSNPLLRGLSFSQVVGVAREHRLFADVLDTPVMMPGQPLDRKHRSAFAKALCSHRGEVFAGSIRFTFYGVAHARRYFFERTDFDTTMRSCTDHAAL